MTVVGKLSNESRLDLKFKDHTLAGDMAGLRECQLAPDILLIYEIDEGVVTLTLFNISSHSNLFK